MAGGVPPCGGPVLLLMPLAPPSALLLLFIYFFSQLQEVEMDSWVELVENNTGSSELECLMLMSSILKQCLINKRSRKTPMLATCKQSSGVLLI